MIMKQIKWILVSIVLVCSLVTVSCTNDDASPEDKYSAATRELITLSTVIRS